MSFFIGLDWAATTHAVCVIDETGAVRWRGTVPHSAAGLAELVQRVARFGPPASLPVALERPSGLVVDTLLEAVDLDPRAAFVVAWSDGDYTTNLPLGDVVNGQAFVAYEYDGKPLAPEHGGPARLVVPGRYFWKSAKWVRGLRLQAEDEPGFWESLGYNNRGDQWREERYSGD